MDIITATTTATSTIYRLTDSGLDLINFLIQLIIFCVGLLAGIAIMHLVILIFK